MMSFQVKYCLTFSGITQVLFTGISDHVTEQKQLLWGRGRDHFFPETVK